MKKCDCRLCKKLKWLFLYRYTRWMYVVFKTSDILHWIEWMDRYIDVWIITPSRGLLLVSSSSSSPRPYPTSVGSVREVVILHVNLSCVISIVTPFLSWHTSIVFQAYLWTLTAHHQLALVPIEDQICCTVCVALSFIPISHQIWIHSRLLLVTRFINWIL